MKHTYEIEFTQQTPMGLSSTSVYTWKCETNTSYNALRKFKSKHKEYIGNERSAYMIYWDYHIIRIDGKLVKQEVKNGKVVYN